jgi:ribosomal protein S18 acetylase RimI-like enzyme
MNEATWAGQQVRIRPAQARDLDQAARLFDAYRQFYRQPPDLAAALAFLRARLQRRESVLLVAETDAGLCGFTQLYPTFCSIAAAPIVVLYDLFVDPAARRHGVGRTLLRAACEHAQACGAVRLELATARVNAPAQALYHSEGWVRDEEFYRYSLAVPR